MRSLHFQRVLGSGAFGAVYLADLVGERGFRRPVAVKVLIEGQKNGEAFLARVRDEARLLGLLQDDHILKVLELANVEGRDAVIMEYVEGVDLAAVVEMGSRPPPRALAEMGSAVAGALHRAHHAVHPATGDPLNVIHRDVKPANVMLTDRGNVKLLDFGVARARFEARESQTGQFVLGTLNYMAPEYIVTGQVTSAADIYGLALTLWEAACGDVFGQPKLRRDLHDARVEERLQVIVGSHGEFVSVLRRMLAWDPASRPDGAMVEREFLTVTDRLQGTGLRSWAAEAIPQVLLHQRSAAKDACGLLNRSVTLGDEQANLSVTGDFKVPDEATLLRTQRPAFLDAPSPMPGTQTARPVAPVPAPSAAALPAGSSVSRARTGPNRRPASRTSGKMLLLQGLIIGGGLGMILFVFIGVLLLLHGLQ